MNDCAAPKVSIIILTWKSYEVTRDCLLSLRSLEYSNFEIVLVDNASGDGSTEKLVREFPELLLIKNEINLGFPGGNNVAIRQVLKRGTDYLLLLNNDTVVAPDFLTEMVRVAERKPEIGMVNPKIYYFEPADRIWYAGGSHKLWWGFARMRGVNQRDEGRYNKIEEVSFITGCACLVKASVVRKIGLLDEIFFLGFEDLDWSVRALNAGFKAFYVPSSVIWHKASYDTKRNLGKPVKDFYSTRNCLLFARKHLPLYQWPLFLLSLSRWVAYRTAGYLLRTEFRRVTALYRGIWSGCVTEVADGNTGKSTPERAPSHGVSSD
jgi:GT2 family glycosyltransferase